MDVLAEKDSLPAPVQVEGHGSGSVPGRVEQVQLFGPELQDLVVSLEDDIDRGGREIRFIPVGRRHDGVAFLDGTGVQFVGGQFAAEIFPEIRRSADVIDVAVREDDRGDLLRVEARALDVAHQRPRAAAGAGIDHDELATEIDDEDRGILRHGDVRSAHKPDALDDHLGLTQCLPPVSIAYSLQSTAYSLQATGRESISSGCWLSAVGLLAC